MARVQSQCHPRIDADALKSARSQPLRCDSDNAGTTRDTALASRMFVVAIARLETSIEQEARALAAGFGTTIFDERQKLLGGMPAIVLITPDESRATALLAELTARGHGALSCDMSKVVATSEMFSLRRFRFDDHALIAYTALADELSWQDVAVLLRATHRQDRHVRVESKTLRVGGLFPAKLTKGVAVRTDKFEPVLYLFRRSERVPWILQQDRAQYSGLGDAVALNAPANFTRAVEQIVARCPHARFDDRLLARKGSPDEMDLLAHLHATWLRRETSIYR